MEIPCCGFTCPVEATLRLVGGKYKAVILWHLMDAGTLRYHELHRRIPRATDKMLAQQLRELERDGLLRRAVYPVVPPKTEYSLTDFGRSLAPILDEMCRWGEWYLAQSSSASSSQSCKRALRRRTSRRRRALSARCLITPSPRPGSAPCSPG